MADQAECEHVLDDREVLDVDNDTEDNPLEPLVVRVQCKRCGHQGSAVIYPDRVMWDY